MSVEVKIFVYTTDNLELRLKIYSVNERKMILSKQGDI